MFVARQEKAAVAPVSPDVSAAICQTRPASNIWSQWKSARCACRQPYGLAAAGQADQGSQAGIITGWSIATMAAWLALRSRAMVRQMGR